MAAVLPNKWACNDGCHQWQKFDSSTASILHPNLFTPSAHHLFLQQQHAKVVPALANNANLRYSDIVEMIFDDSAIDEMIRGTNAYGMANDPKWVDTLSPSTYNRSLMKCYVAVRIMKGIKQCTTADIFANDESRGVSFLSAAIGRDKYQQLDRNICFNEYDYLHDAGFRPRPDEKFFHGMDSMLSNCMDLVRAGSCLALDEMRVPFSSRRSKLGTFVPGKPVKKGRNIESTAIGLQQNAGVKFRGFVTGFLPYNASKTYDRALNINPSEGKCDNKVHQLIVQNRNKHVNIRNCIVTSDSGYNSLYLYDTLYPNYNVHGCGAIRKGRKCLPAYFKIQNWKTATKKWTKGTFEQWYFGDTHLTVYQDSKLVFFIDNCFDQRKLVTIQRRSKNVMHSYQVPYVVKYYNENMGEVDTANARRKNYSMDSRQSRKHNPCYWLIWDSIVLVNSCLIYYAVKGRASPCHATNGQKGLRLELVQKWADEHNRLMHSLSLSTRIAKRKTQSALESTLRQRGFWPDPNREHKHELTRIGPGRKRIKCFVHKKKSTFYKCNTCSIYKSEFGFCHPGRTNRNCFALFPFHL